MHTLAAFLIASSVFIHSASAADRVVVSCTETGFSDLAKIEIRETDLSGQYQIVADGYVSPVFGMAELEKGESLELPSWNGYARRIVRDGRDSYSIAFEDECSGGAYSIACTETF